MKKIELGMTLFVLCGIQALVSCDGFEDKKQAAEEYQRRLPKMEQSGIFSGPREKTFEENYNLKISLPMPEKQFLALLDRLKLRYDILGKRSGIIPEPFWCRAIDVSQMRRAYQIYGNLKSMGRVGEAYTAYVDTHGDVVYLENTFVYEGP